MWTIWRVEPLNTWGGGSFNSGAETFFLACFVWLDVCDEWPLIFFACQIFRFVNFLLVFLAFPIICLCELGVVCAVSFTFFFKIKFLFLIKVSLIYIYGKKTISQYARHFKISLNVFVTGTTYQNLRNDSIGGCPSISRLLFHHFDGLKCKQEFFFLISKKRILLIKEKQEKHRVHGSEQRKWEKKKKRREQKDRSSH